MVVLNFILRVIAKIGSCIDWARKRMARFFVILYAKYEFGKAMHKADQLYDKYKEMWYVTSEPFHPDRLTIYNRKRFKFEKPIWGWDGQLLTLTGLKWGCYYHTPDKAGNQAMKKHDIEVRRRYFIRERLIRSEVTLL